MVWRQDLRVRVTSEISGTIPRDNQQEKLGGNYMKKLVTSFICAAILLSNGMLGPVSVSALEEVNGYTDAQMNGDYNYIIHSEDWVANVYLGNDLSTLQPGLICKADVYSDGCLRITANLTDDIRNMSGKLLITYGSVPISTESLYYKLSQGPYVVCHKNDCLMYPVRPDTMDVRRIGSTHFSEILNSDWYPDSIKEGVEKLINTEPDSSKFKDFTDVSYFPTDGYVCHVDGYSSRGWYGAANYGPEHSLSLEDISIPVIRVESSDRELRYIDSGQFYDIDSSLESRVTEGRAIDKNLCSLMWVPVYPWYTYNNNTLGPTLCFEFIPKNTKLEYDSSGSYTINGNLDSDKEYKFRIFEHDITISRNIINSYMNKETVNLNDAQVQELVDENERLRANCERLAAVRNINQIRRLDTDGNGIIDAKDATTILKIYAINSTGGNIQTLDDLKNYN